jgi:hypothetical protein
MPSARGWPPRKSRVLAVAGLLLGVAVVAALLREEEEPPAQPSGVTILQDDALLLHGSDARVARVLGDIRALGVDWVRLTAGWSAIAPEPAAARPPAFDARDPGAYPAGAWDALDRAVRLADERGLRTLIDIAFFAPRWAVASPAGPADRQRRGIDAPAYADFAEAVARRYPEAAAFTVWNEPNFRAFLMPQWRRGGGGWIPASPHAYRELLLAAAPRIRSAAPDALLLIGGTAALGAERPASESDGVAPLRFVRELACVDERLEPLERPECRDFRALPGDGFAHHPLSLDRPPWERDPEPDNVRMADLGRLTALLRRLHERGRLERRLPVYVTEYGYQTDPPDPTARATPEEQARWLPEADRIAWEEPGVASFAQFLLRDVGERPGRTVRDRWRDSQMGLRFVDGRAKPAERSFAWSLAARRAGPARVELWVRLRAARGPDDVRISRRSGGGWRVVAGPARTDSRGVRELTVEGDPDGTYRLEVRDGGRWVAPGLPVRPR